MKKVCHRRRADFVHADWRGRRAAHRTARLGQTSASDSATAGLRLDAHFFARIPNAGSISPIIGTNREGGGGIAAARGEALAVAREHLLRIGQKRAGVRPMRPAQ